MPVFTNLKKLKNFFVFVGVTVLVFDLSYYMMSVLPGSRDLMCVEGANLTPVNIIFSLVLSMMIGIMMVGFIALFAQKLAKKKAALTSLSGFGLVIGTMSVICLPCTLPVISLFGLTIWMDFLTNNELLFKVLSLGMMGAALYLLNKQLKNACAFCVAES